MPDITTNYGLTKPLPNENYNIQHQNDNMDVIDGKLKEVEDDAAASVKTSEKGSPEGVASLDAAGKVVDAQLDIGRALGYTPADAENEHTHINKTVLDKFTETNGKVLYNGELIGVGVQNNYNATAEPTVNDDGLSGYEPGSVWIATIGLVTSAWLCLNETTGEAVWNKIAEHSDGDDPSGSPGSGFLIGGDMTEGFFGEVASAELITGDALASEVGISAGTSQNSTAGWLKFALDGKILFVAKKPIRHTISWNNINAANCVYGGKTVVIGGLTYKVRLMKGAEVDPFNYEATDRDAIGSEWNRLMLPIHVNAPSSWVYPAFVASPTKDWGIDYTDTDLVTASTAGDGSYSWCQETRSSDTARRVARGGGGVSGSDAGASSTATASYGWRPVLELVI